VLPQRAALACAMRRLQHGVVRDLLDRARSDMWIVTSTVRQLVVASIMRTPAALHHRLRRAPAASRCVRVSRCRLRQRFLVDRRGDDCADRTARASATASSIAARGRGAGPRVDPAIGASSRSAEGQ